MESVKIPFLQSYEVTRSSQRTTKQYRPLSTRPWILLSFVLATGVCFGLLVAVSLIDKETSINTKRDLNALRERHVELYQRQTTVASAATSIDLSLETPCYTTFTATETYYLSTIGEGTPSSTPTTSYTGSCSATTITVVDTGSLLVLQEPCTVTLTAAVTEYISPDGSTSADTSSDYYTGTCDAVTVTMTMTSLLSLTSQSTTTTFSVPPTLTTTSSALLSLDDGNDEEPSTTVAPVSQISDGQVSGLSLTSQDDPTTSGTTIMTYAPGTSILTLSSAASGAVLSLTPTASATASAVFPSSTSSDAQRPTGVASSGMRVTTSVIMETSYVTPIPSISSTENIDDPLLVVVNGTTYLASAYPGTDVTGLRSTTTSSSPSISSQATSAASDNSKSNKTKSIDPTVNAELVLLKIDFHKYDYFLAVYLPKIVAVIMASVWSIIFAGLKLMEPLYQLSTPSGAFGKEVLFGNYLSSEFNLASLLAVSRGQWTLILGGSVLLLWAAVVALVSEFSGVISTDTCKNADGDDFRCAPGWVVSQSILKILLAILGLILLLTTIIAWIVFRRKRSGVYADPSSIAAMADLLGNTIVLEEFRGIDPSASDGEVRILLGESRYKLGYYDTVTGKEGYTGTTEQSEQRYGLIKVAGDTTPAALASAARPSYGAVSNPSIRSVDEARVNRKRRIWQSVYDAVMLLTIIVIFALVLGYYLDGGKDPLNNFFNSNDFGPRFVLTGLALIVSTGWRITSQQVTLMAPYRSMARAFHRQTGVPGRRSILAATACTPFTAFHKGLKLRNSMIVAVATSAILGEILLVAVSGVPFSASQILPSLQASTFTSLGVLFIMFVTEIAVIIHNRTSAGGSRRLPRCPDTLIGVWLYLCGSKLAAHEDEDLDGHHTEQLDNFGLAKKYGAGNYAFGRAEGVDKIPRWTVDEAAELYTPRTESQPQQTPYQLRMPSRQSTQTNLQANPQTQQYTPSTYSVQSNPFRSPTRRQPILSQIQEVPILQTPVVERRRKPQMSQIRKEIPNNQRQAQVQPQPQPQHHTKQHSSRQSWLQHQAQTQPQPQPQEHARPHQSQPFPSRPTSREFSIEVPATRTPSPPRQPDRSEQASMLQVSNQANRRTRQDYRPLLPSQQYSEFVRGPVSYQPPSQNDRAGRRSRMVPDPYNGTQYRRVE